MKTLSLRNNGYEFSKVKTSDTFEVGSALCKIGNRKYLGKVQRGKDKWGVDVKLDCGGGSVEGVWHTHPDGEPVPSEPDIQQARMHNLRTMCITAINNRKKTTKCYNVSNIR